MTAVDVTAAQAGVGRAPARAPRATSSDWLRDLNHLSDALLHPRRRRAARFELQNLRPRTILFVCHGNICRSPFAAAAFSRACPRHVSKSIIVASAGFIGPDRSPPSKALAASARFGIDISCHRSALVTSGRLCAADLVVVMSAEQARGVRARLGSNPSRVIVLGDLDPSPITRRTISDPWGGPDSAFDASYDRIDRCVRELARLIQDGIERLQSRATAANQAR